jgi:hypothetical protein
MTFVGSSVEALFWIWMKGATRMKGTNDVVGRDNLQDPREDRGSAKGKVEMANDGTDGQTAKNAKFAKTDRLPADATGLGPRLGTTTVDYGRIKGSLKS